MLGVAIRPRVRLRTVRVRVCPCLRAAARLVVLGSADEAGGRALRLGAVLARVRVRVRVRASARVRVRVRG